MLDWRQYLTDANIPWIDRGKNCSKGNININCPWCEDDPSYHLAISENIEAYYCHRAPEHSGININKLLVKLGTFYGSIPDVLNRYDFNTPFQLPPKKPNARSTNAWQKFESAADSPRCIDYLRERGFITPVATCRQYDLRYSRAGKWAQRLLFPITDGVKVVSWTGRSVKTNISPKYLTETNDLNNYIYIPRSIRGTLIIVEGPMDALKIAAATSNRDISSIALLGKNISIHKIEQIANIAQECNEVLISLDIDVPIHSSYGLIYELQSRLSCTVRCIEPPYGVKDPAELDFPEINDWIPC